MLLNVIRALYEDDFAIPVCYACIAESSTPVSEVYLATRTNMELKNLRAKLYKLHNANLIEKVSYSMWKIDENFVQSMLNTWLKSIEETTSLNDDDEYFCEKCSISVDAIDLIDQLKENADNLCCLICSGVLGSSSNYNNKLTDQIEAMRKLLNL